MERCLVRTRLVGAHGCIQSIPVAGRLPLALAPVSKLRHERLIRSQGAKVEVEISDKQPGGRIEMKREGELLESVLWRAHDIQARVAELGQAISTDFDGHPIVILGVTTLTFSPEIVSIAERGNCCM